MKPNNTNTAKSKGSSRLSNVKYVFRHPLVYGGAFALMFTIISIIVTFLLFKSIPYMVCLVGPLLAVEFSLIITGLYNAISTTTTLDYELDAVCPSGNYNKGQIIIRVKNTGRNVAEDTYALIDITVREIGSSKEKKEKKYLGKYLADKDLCRNLVIADEDPRIEDEYLLWLSSPEGVTKVPIDPGHGDELLVFKYERAPDGYVIKVTSKKAPSEKGVDKPRVCLWLDFNTKYVFHITFYGNNVRGPLKTELYITMDKLDAIASSKAMQAMLRNLRNFDEEEIAREVFNIVLKELSNDWGITKRTAELILINNMGKYLEFASKFEALWNELRNRFREEPKWAEYLGSIFGVLYEYAVYLALAKKWDELTSFIRNNRLLSSCNDDGCVMMKLLLNLIITDEEFRKRFSDWLTGGNIYDTLKYYVPNRLRPALAHLLNYGQITCKSACGCDEEEECSNQKCYNNCKRMLNALNGNKSAVHKIASELDSVLRRQSKEESAPPMLIKEIIDYVRNNRKPQDWGFFSRAVVELRLPTTSRLRFILILHNLLRAREEFERGSIDGAVKFMDLAEAHAVIGRVKFKSKRDKETETSSLHLSPLSAGNLFDSVRILTSKIKSDLEKNKKNKKFEISSEYVLTLLRLYHYHVQTNLAETWP